MTIPIQTLAIVLIIAHIISDIFMVRVLIRQWSLFKVPYDNFGIEKTLIKEIKRFRITLFTLSCIVFAGNIIPIIIDGITIFGDNPLHRNPTVPVISILYAVSNALTALISAYLIYTLYRIARASGDDHILEKAAEVI